MAVTINGKVYRNLQEQVAENANDIAALQEQVAEIPAVVANPEEDAEEELETLKVGDVVYEIPAELPSKTGNAGKFLKVNAGATGVEWADVSGGTTLYKHVVSLAYPYNSFTIINKSTSSIDTMAKLLDAIKDPNCISCYSSYSTPSGQAGKIYGAVNNMSNDVFVYMTISTSPALSTFTIPYNQTINSDTITTF